MITTNRVMKSSVTARVKPMRTLGTPGQRERETQECFNIPMEQNTEFKDSHADDLGRR